MDPVTIETAIATIIKIAVDVGPTVIDGIEKARPFAQTIYGIFKGTNVTEDQLADLIARSRALSAELQAPLPPEQS